MIPTINDLSKEKLVANDAGETVADKEEVVSIARTAANDTVDAVAKTMDRIMERHSKPARYRDARGKYSTRQKAASNDKIDAVEKTMDRIMARHNAHDEVIPVPANDLPTAAELTMDRIMARHNGHDNAPGRMDAANENRIIHDYNPNVPQAERKTPVLIEEEETPASDVLSPVEKKEEKREPKKDDISQKDEMVPLLRSIDSNTTNSVDLLKLIRQDIDDINVESQKAREKDLEKGKGYIAGNRESISGMDPEGNPKGKDKEKPGFLQSLAGATTGLVTTAVVGAAGAVGSWLMPETQPDNKGGGFDGSGQTAGQKASGRHGGAIPMAAPSMPSHIQAPTSQQRANMEKLLFNAFKKQGYTDEGAKTMVAEVGRENGFRKDLIFGTHIDPGNHAINMGMISWQGDRAKRLKKYLEDRGLFKDGHMVQSEATIEAQIAFLDDEMQHRLGKKGVAARNALFDKSKKYRDIEGLIGDNVIAWTRTHPGKNMSYDTWLKIRNGGYHNQDQAAGEVDALLRAQQAKRGSNLNQKSAQTNSKPNVVVINKNSTSVNQNVANNNHKPQPNKKVPPAKSESWSDWASKYFHF